MSRFGPGICGRGRATSLVARRYDNGVPLSPEEFYRNALRDADVDRRMSLSRMTGWEIFPFEPEGLRVVPLAAPVLPEPARYGEGSLSCRNCSAGDSGVIWSNDRWRLTVFDQPSGAPLVVMLTPHDHYDLVDLPDDLASELGMLIVHVARAIESLSHVARAHVSRWGDGGAHLHVFFFARPEGFIQLRGTCLAIWDDLLAAVPRNVRDGDAREVAVTLAKSFGGRFEAPTRDE